MSVVCHTEVTTMPVARCIGGLAQSSGMDSAPPDPSAPDVGSRRDDAPSTIDWRELAAMPPPLLPTVDQSRSREAWRRLQAYRPDPLNLVDRRRALLADVERLVAAEEAERASKLDGWRVQMRAWSSLCELAARALLGGDASAIEQAIIATTVRECGRELDAHSHVLALTRVAAAGQGGPGSVRTQ
jgi:hypothetical protein